MAFKFDVDDPDYLNAVRKGVNEYHYVLSKDYEKQSVKVEDLKYHLRTFKRKTKDVEDEEIEDDITSDHKKRLRDCTIKYMEFGIVQEIRKDGLYTAEMYDSITDEIIDSLYITIGEYSYLESKLLSLIHI